MQALAGMLENEDIFFTRPQSFCHHAALLILRNLLPTNKYAYLLQWIGWISPLWHATELDDG
jgi:hypothetical protein